MVDDGVDEQCWLGFLVEGAIFFLPSVLLTVSEIPIHVNYNNILGLYKTTLILTGHTYNLSLSLTHTHTRTRTRTRTHTHMLVFMVYGDFP